MDYDRGAAAAETAAMAAAVRRARRERREAVTSRVPGHVVARRWVVGTAPDCDVRVTTDARVAEHHAILSLLVDGSAVVEPLPGGRDATYVVAPGETAARPVGHPTPVRPGGAVVVGSTVYPWRRT